MLELRFLCSLRWRPWWGRLCHCRPLNSMMDQISTGAVSSLKTIRHEKELCRKVMKKCGMRIHFGEVNEEWCLVGGTSHWRWGISWGGRNGRDTDLWNDHTSHSPSTCAIGAGEEVEKLWVKLSPGRGERWEAEEFRLILISYYPTLILIGHKLN